MIHYGGSHLHVARGNVCDWNQNQIKWSFFCSWKFSIHEQSLSCPLEQLHKGGVAMILYLEPHKLSNRGWFHQSRFSILVANASTGDRVSDYPFSKPNSPEARRILDSWCSSNSGISPFTRSQNRSEAVGTRIPAAISPPCFSSQGAVREERRSKIHDSNLDFSPSYRNSVSRTALSWERPLSRSSFFLLRRRFSHSGSDLDASVWDILIWAKVQIN